jgi:hypothetical protein
MKPPGPAQCAIQSGSRAFSPGVAPQHTWVCATCVSTRGRTDLRTRSLTLLVARSQSHSLTSVRDRNAHVRDDGVDGGSGRAPRLVTAHAKEGRAERWSSQKKVNDCDSCHKGTAATEESNYVFFFLLPANKQLGQLRCDDERDVAGQFTPRKNCINTPRGHAAARLACPLSISPARAREPTVLQKDRAIDKTRASERARARQRHARCTLGTR